MWTYNYTDELYHHGVKGMKWGVRKASKYTTRYVRGHGGPGHYLTRKSQLKGDKRDLEKLNRGEHLSVGLTKKRQAKYDARDRRLIEKRIAKNEAHFKAKEEKKAAKEASYSKDHKEAREIKKKKVSEMSNEELRTLNKRMQLEQDYRRLNPSAMAKGKNYLMAAVAVTGAVLTLQGNSDKLIKLGQKVLGA